MTTPWIANGAVMVEGERYALGGRRGTEVREGPGVCQFHLTGRGISVSGDVTAPLEDSVGWVYADPAAASTTRSTARSPTCAFASSRRNGPCGRSRSAAVPRTSWACASTDHGMKIQPFPDG